MTSQRSRRPASGSDGKLRQVYSVSRLNQAARQALEQTLGYVWVEGEISNLARPASGHWYFSLKDSQSQVRCAMFRNRNRAVRFEPEAGMAVIAYGQVSLYPARGDYQLIVESLEPAGDGLLQLKFEQLKRKLHAEDLFNPIHKQDLPAWPTRIGVVSSVSGAALQDVLTVLKRRCPGIEVVVYPAVVQGDSAAASIVQAIESANRRAECDVLIVGRGGGSIEDLWAFNEEPVARAIFASAIPLVSAVGHEIDFTIADLVADCRAATPSAAAEMVSPDTREMQQQLSRLQYQLAQSSRRLIEYYSQQLRISLARLISPRRQLESQQQRADELSNRLQLAIQRRLNESQLRTHNSLGRIRAQAPHTAIRHAQARVLTAQTQLTQAWRQLLQSRQQRLQRYESLIRAYGPEETLQRGYAIVQDNSGALVVNADSVALGQKLNTRLATGSFSSTVTETRNNQSEKN